MEGGRWVLGEAGKDLLDDCQVECLHLGPILVDGEGGKVNQMTIQSYPKVLSHAEWILLAAGQLGYHLIQVSEFSCVEQMSV